jgi:hypothetical protein
LAELALRGVAPLVVSDTLEPAGFDVLARGTAGGGGQEGSPETAAELAVQFLLGRLSGSAERNG